eukprot:TRINITY_DN8867_c0_g1_i1.p1 TRINITY_DN8867_c0_g1~~TRINITY_DN8867_c0_g1_i1.p1  ORF type:complete len:1005 (+),score=164.45 TRINITY_DN8867_c0_g1_i1:83-3016(+)
MAGRHSGDGSSPVELGHPTPPGSGHSPPPLPAPPAPPHPRHQRVRSWQHSDAAQSTPSHAPHHRRERSSSSLAGELAGNPSGGHHARGRSNISSLAGDTPGWHGRNSPFEIGTVVHRPVTPESGHRSDSPASVGSEMEAVSGHSPVSVNRSPLAIPGAKIPPPHGHHPPPAAVIQESGTMGSFSPEPPERALLVVQKPPDESARYSEAEASGFSSTSLDIVPGGGDEVYDRGLPRHLQHRRSSNGGRTPGHLAPPPTCRSTISPESVSPARTPTAAQDTEAAASSPQRYRVVWPHGVRSRRCRTLGGVPASPGAMVLGVDEEFAAAEPAGGGWVQLPGGRWVPLWNEHLPVIEPIHPPVQTSLTGRAMSVFDIVVRCVLAALFVWLVLKVLLDLKLTCGSAESEAPAAAPAVSPAEFVHVPAVAPADEYSQPEKQCGLGQGIPSTGGSGDAATYVVIICAVLTALHQGFTAACRKWEWTEKPLLWCTIPFLLLFFALDMVYQILFALVGGLVGCGACAVRAICGCGEEDDTADEVEAALNLDEVAPLLADTTRGTLAVLRSVKIENCSVGLGYCMGYKPEELVLLRGVPLREAICSIVRRQPELFPAPEEASPGMSQHGDQLQGSEYITEPASSSSGALGRARESPRAAEPEEPPPKSCCRKFCGVVRHTPFLSAAFFIGFPCLFYVLAQYGLRHCSIASAYEFYGVMMWAYIGPYTGESIVLYQRARGLILANLNEPDKRAIDVQNLFLMEWVLSAVTGNVIMTSYFLCFARHDIMWLVGKARQYLRFYTDRYEAGDAVKLCGSVGLGKRWANLCRIVVMPSLLGATLGAKVVLVLAFTPAVSQWVEKLIWASLDRDRTPGMRALVVAGCAVFSSLLDLIDDLPNNIALFWAAVQVIEDNYPGSQELPFFSSTGSGCYDFLTYASIGMQWLVFIVLAYFLVKPGLCCVLTGAASHLPTPSRYSEHVTHGELPQAPL